MPLLCDLCTLYFADGEGRGLQASRRPVVYYQKQNPRALLLELSKGPQPYDEVPGLAAVMPVGSLSDADILGLALSGRTVLVNFAPAFLEAGQGMDGQQERLFVDAMTNTLCENQTIGSAARSLRLWGGAGGVLRGDLCSGGEFYPLKISAGERKRRGVCGFRFFVRAFRARGYFSAGPDAPTPAREWDLPSHRRYFQRTNRRGAGGERKAPCLCR